jgi:hypothetical protein
MLLQLFDRWELIPFAVVLIGIAFARIMSAFDAHKVRLVDPKTKQEYVKRLTTSRYRDYYQFALRTSLDRLDAIFGNGLFRMQGLATCVTIAFLYCLFGFIFAWSVGGPGKIGRTALLPDSWPVPTRLGFALLVFFTCGTLFAFSTYPLRVILFFQRMVRGRSGMRLSTYTALARGLMILLALSAYLYTWSFIYPALLIVVYCLLGTGLTLCLFGGAAVAGSLAALLSGAYGDGTQRFVCAIAVLAAVALGGSLSAGGVSNLFCRYYRRIPHTKTGKRFVEQYVRLSVHVLIGSVGGAIFLVAGSHTYRAILGPGLDSAMTEALGFGPDSPLILVSGLGMGALGGLFATWYGYGGVFFGAFWCAALLLLSLYANYSLHNLFGLQSVIGVALINMMLFFVILPLFKGSWDWIAWDASRSLSRRLLHTSSRAMVLWQLFWVFAIGIVLLVGFTASLSFAFSAFNKWMINHTQPAPLSIYELARLTMTAPFSVQGVWVIIMLFSTLIPSFSHFLFLSSATAFLWTPDSLRRRLALDVQQATNSDDVTGAAVYFTLMYIVGAVSVLIVIAAGVLFARAVGTPISDVLFQIVQWTSL